MDIAINVDGTGDYEFALDNENGPYQTSNFFNDLEPRNYTIFLRDINGCGIQRALVEIDLRTEGFPKFFTPNGDNINDLWQYSPTFGDEQSRPTNILIFNRYGNLLAQLFPNSLGWDGTYNGVDLPSSNYWYQAYFEDDEIINGYFVLER